MEQAERAIAAMENFMIASVGIGGCFSLRRVKIERLK
jgi:hypothetical protein